VAAGHSVEVDPARWQELFDEVMGRVAGRFARVEPRRHARALVLGLLADLPRKNCWTIAEHAGQATPDGLQHLLAGAVWDHGAVRDDVRALVVEHLGDPGAVLVIDETGDLKKGSHTVGVGRQYTGTAGKVDNAQVAVYLATPPPPGTAWSTASSTCPKAGPTILPAATPPASPTRSASPPRRTITVGQQPHRPGDADAQAGQPQHHPPDIHRLVLPSAAPVRPGTSIQPGPRTGAHPPARAPH
jgi:hypothetical protein